MRVLVLCTGNSCRSQMAHGFLQHLCAQWEVYSAGTNPAERVNPMAVRVMAEVDIDISQHTPHAVCEYLHDEWDYVITVCGGANESCPMFIGNVSHRLHKGFDDPSDMVGLNEERLLAFRRVRDEIYRWCVEFVKNKM